jgi:hypothetical protein
MAQYSFPLDGSEWKDAERLVSWECGICGDTSGRYVTKDDAIAHIRLAHGAGTVYPRVNPQGRKAFAMLATARGMTPERLAEVIDEPAFLEMIGFRAEFVHGEQTQQEETVTPSQNTEGKKVSQSNRFLDLEIRIDPCRDDAYPVEITLGSGQEFQGYLPTFILPWTSTGDPVQDGQKLFADLFADQALRTAWDHALGQSPQRRIRLRIATAAPKLHAIPWELLRPDDDPSQSPLAASADTPFSRYLAVPKPWGGTVEEHPIRVLALISDPQDLEDVYNLPPLDVDVEQDILRQAFSDLDKDEIELSVLDPPITLENVEKALQTGYRILHYVGHGVFHSRRQQAALYLQDEDGDTEIVHDAAFIEMLARQPAQARPRLIFLASCHTATRSTADAFLGLAPKLVTAGVPAVIAMQDFVAIKTARKLSMIFYRRLIEHGMVDCALNQARSILLTAGRLDAAVPVLFMRLKSGQLWESTVDQPEDPPTPGPKYNIHTKDSKIGVVGDHAKIEGGIHF